MAKKLTKLELWKNFKKTSARPQAHNRSSDSREITATISLPPNGLNLQQNRVQVQAATKSQTAKSQPESQDCKLTVDHDLALISWCHYLLGPILQLPSHNFAVGHDCLDMAEVL